ncbi:alpha/beta hydrolase fold domain-containing protein [Pacificimonas sp. WHA3]|uniref:Alpha/beta hydrolase fold domain-containing protein n=1 Tax=Pacificimonas pallii TaxID=2827236 RepID=A0ABS6SHG9_9SPHN|nr:alpha/beta hydrolase fold domain-containing protein [Pacificimonas pallii]MBV7257341.1 alpha/beta hydrolase fold domain-containing protein [Pacificimonas pallii]
MSESSVQRLRRAMIRVGRPRRVRMDGVSVSDGDIAGMAARTYRPREVRGAAPMVYFHGGGFMVGDLDSHDRLCSRLAALAGLEIVSIAYRLVPPHRPPAQLDDALAACAALGESGQILAGGDSAGGYLAGRCALGMPGAVSGLILLYPLLQMDPALWTDRVFGASRWAGRIAVSQMARLGLAEAYAPLVDMDLSGLPPTVIAAGGWFDPVSPDIEPFADILDRHEVPVDIVRARGLVHGELCFPDRSRRAESLLREVAAASARLGLTIDE